MTIDLLTVDSPKPGELRLRETDDLNDAQLMKHQNKWQNCENKHGFFQASSMG